MKLGTIVSLNGTPNCEEIYFVVENPVKKGEFFQVNNEGKKIIGRIADIISSNPYLDNAEVVKGFGERLYEHFPVKEWEYSVAKGILLGQIVNGREERVREPPRPGNKVYKIDENVLKDFLGIDENGLKVGRLDVHDLEVGINLSKLFQKHLAILATSGSGKSYLASVLIEELLSREDSPAIFVIDPHGEYAYLEDVFRGKVKVFDSFNISIDINDVTPNLFSEFIPQMTSVQKRELARILGELRKKKQRFEYEDLIKEIENSEADTRTKSALISWIESIGGSTLFSKVTYPDLLSVLLPSTASVLNLSNIIHLKERQIIITFFLRKIFTLRRNKEIPPVIIFVEEAHQFCPEGREREEAISKAVIETIAREGRKFGVSLVLISQRPIKLSTTALSQCNTFILLRIVNPYDIEHIAKSSESLTRDIIRSLPGLKVGEAFITGEGVKFPFLFKVRKRKFEAKTVLGENLEEAVKEFLENKRKIKEDLEAFK